MIPDKAPKEDVFHGSEELKKEAHIPSFEKYKELYLKSIEHPDGKSTFIVFKCSGGKVESSYNSYSISITVLQRFRDMESCAKANT